MPNYRLVFAGQGNRGPRTIEFDGADAAEALLIAQRHQSPAQLWEDDRHLCTLHRSGSDGELWIISRDQDRARATAGTA